jgi:hypothetical protein
MKLDLVKDKEIFLSEQRTLKGKAKFSQCFLTFIITEKQAPSVLDLKLINKSNFFKKAVYSLTIEKIEESESKIKTSKKKVKSKLMEYNTEKNEKKEEKKQEIESVEKKGEKLKIKIYVNKDIRSMNLSTEIKYEELTNKLNSDYNEELIIKYLDKESELITIKSQEDLTNFFEEVKESNMKNIKLYLELASTTPLTKKMILDMDNTSPKVTGNETTFSGLTSQLLASQNETNENLNHIKSWSKGNMLGAGAYGKVFIGLNNDNGKFMAVKQFELDEKSCPNEVITSLEKEINIMSQLSHPNIVRYLGTEKTKKHLYIFLNFISGIIFILLIKKKKW